MKVGISTLFILVRHIKPEILDTYEVCKQESKETTSESKCSRQKKVVNEKYMREINQHKGSENQIKESKYKEKEKEYRTREKNTNRGVNTTTTVRSREHKSAVNPNTRVQTYTSAADRYGRDQINEAVHHDVR